MVEERAGTGVEDLTGVVPEWKSIFKVKVRKFRKSEIENIALYEDEVFSVLADDVEEAQKKAVELAKAILRNDEEWSWSGYEIRSVVYEDSVFVDAHWVGGPSPAILTEPQQTDSVNHPSHYTFGKFEVIDVIEDWGLGYHLGNAIKYIARSPHKGKPVEDLNKAIWYLKRFIELYGD